MKQVALVSEFWVILTEFASLYFLKMESSRFAEKMENFDIPIGVFLKTEVVL
jgi:hypothetical protein